VLDDHAHRRLELEREAERSVGVEQVVVAEFLATQLPRGRQARRRVADRVERGRLVRFSP